MDKVNNIFKLEKPIILGKIGSSYGVRGWLKIFSFTEKAENIFNYKPWFIRYNKNWIKLNFKNWKFFYNHLIVKLVLNDNLNSLISLTNYEIIIDSSQLPILKNNEFYINNLINCKVINMKGILLGKINAIIKTKANDILLLKNEFQNLYNNKEILIPLINKTIVKKIDFKKHIIYVNWDLNY